jgi:transposase-like protein
MGFTVRRIFYVRYVVSDRDLEEIMAKRGVDIDHATLNAWVMKFLPLIAANAQSRKKPTTPSWRTDETYIKVRGNWTYLYRAVDRDGQTLDFMLSERRDTTAARRFFKRAVRTNGVPDRIAINKSGANLAGLQTQMSDSNSRERLGSSVSFSPNTSTIYSNRTIASSSGLPGQCSGSRLSTLRPLR